MVIKITLKDNLSLGLSVAILKIQTLSSFELSERIKNKIIERTPITKLIILSYYTDTVER